MEYDPQQPLRIPLPPPRKHNTITNIIVVILTIILMSLLFFGVVVYFSLPHYPHTTATTPTGAFNFTETSPGNYTGGLISFSESGVDLSNIAMVILHGSMSNKDTVEKLYNHATVEVEGGLRCTFEDVNSNNQLDINDRFYVWKAGPEDILKLVYIGTGGVMAQYTFD